MPALARALFERAAGDACLYEGRFVKVLHGGMVNASPGVATLLLRREPANAMSLDVWEELTAGLRAAEEDEVRGERACGVDEGAMLLAAHAAAVH